MTEGREARPPRNDVAAPTWAEHEPPLASKVDVLRRPSTYPRPTSRVETVETHMAWVFLTDTRAYKLKKPVRHDFLDFSTLAARREDCRDEVRLNRRLAGDVYLGVVALTLEPDGELALDGDGEAVDWLVKMRRLPRDRNLERLIHEDRVPPDDVRKAARLLASFYREADPEPMEPHDYPERLRQDLVFREVHVLDGRYELPDEPVRRVARSLLDFVAHEGAVLEQRAVDRRIIEAHGDLRPEHVFLTSPPVIIDCLEFRREFRLLDPADELSFLWMECHRLGAPEVGDLFLDVYREEIGDRPPERLLHFYRSYRAVVRATLAAWHTLDHAVNEHEKWLGRTREYLREAELHLPG